MQEAARELDRPLGCGANPYAPETGKMANVEANNQARMIPSHICGVAVST